MHRQAVYKGALFLTHELSVGCYERGALLACLWNYYTAFLDTRLQSHRTDLNDATKKIQDLERKNKRCCSGVCLREIGWRRFRLESRLDWVYEAEREMANVTLENERLRRALFIAETERDFLIRKGDEGPKQNFARQRWALAIRLIQNKEQIKQLKVPRACIEFCTCSVDTLSVAERYQTAVRLRGIRRRNGEMPSPTSTHVRRQSF